MSKKDKAADLISGILGGKTPAQETAPRPKQEPELKRNAPETSLEELGLSPDLVEALERERKKGVGRKPKTDLRSPKEYGCKIGETRATFILPKEFVTKLKYISVMETRTLKNLLYDVLGDFIDQWEKENGVINIKSKEQ